MELSHCLIYLLLVVLSTTSSLPSDRAYSLKNRKKIKKLPGTLVSGDNGNSKDNTLYIDINEDSSSVDDLAKKALSALSVTNGVSESKKSLSEKLDELSRRRVRRRSFRKDEQFKMIFGEDDRVNLSSSREAQTYPFSTAVMLSSGCTGTLIGNQHVLTAAHCVHNGIKRLRSARQLQVGFLQRSGKFHMIRVQRNYIPKKWKKQPPSKDRLRYDFAVLKLVRQHNRQPMSVSSSSLLLGSKIQFSGFHGDKSYNSLWFTKCRVKGKSNDMIFNRCDGFKGVSGSGVYVDTLHGDENVVVGVVSAIGRGTVRGKAIQFNIVNSLTKPKVRQILKWVARR